MQGAGVSRERSWILGSFEEVDHSVPLVLAEIPDLYFY